MARLPRIDGIKRLYKTLADVPPNIASLTLGPDGSVSATFFQRGGSESGGSHAPDRAGSTPAPATKLIPGTQYVDDKTPISIADLTLEPIPLEDSN